MLNEVFHFLSGDFYTGTWASIYLYSHLHFTWFALASVYSDCGSSSGGVPGTLL